jgi:large subunit ribosomal protein L9
MEVILLQDVDKVGLRGEVVSVARGYMRNYLAPRRLAEEATPARVAELEKRDSQRARHEAASFDQAQEIADKLSQAELRFDVNAGPQGTLFGSVTATDIADEIWKQLRCASTGGRSISRTRSSASAATRSPSRSLPT